MTRFSVAFEGDRPLSEYRGLAAAAERHGFYSFQIYEHLPFRPAWPIVFSLAKYTRSIRIGPVTVPAFLYQPLDLARNLAALSESTNDRAILGLSRGAYGEYLGRQLDRSSQAVIETVEATRALLDGRDYHGRIHRVNSRQGIGWHRKTDVEIYIGTSGPRLAAAASRCQAVSGIIVDNLWNAKYAGELRELIDDSVSHLNRKDRVSLIARPFTFVSERRRDAARMIEPILKSYLPQLIGDSPMLPATGVSYEELLELTKKTSKMPEELLKNFAAFGTPAEILDQTAQMLKAGADQVCYGHPLGRDPVKSMRLLGETVIPHFA